MIKQKQLTQKEKAHMNGTKKTGQLQDALINQEGFLAALLQPVIQSIIQEEFQKHIGAKEYERTDSRKGLRNGYYERQLQTRVGALTLFVCRDRAGQFKTELFERYQRSEKALITAMAEMVLNGVSTRKVSNVFEDLCGYSISKSQVSELTSKLDEQVKAWRERSLEKEFIYLAVDARYEKVRENGAVISKAFVTIAGITYGGIREIIGTYIINSESYESWDDCFKDLIERGLKGVKFVVSDDNKGLRKALQKYFQDAILQRCQVHFMRNFIFKLARSEQAEGIKLLQEVFAADTKVEAMKRAQKTYEFLLSKKKIK